MPAALLHGCMALLPALPACDPSAAPPATPPPCLVHSGARPLERCCGPQRQPQRRRRRRLGRRHARNTPRRSRPRPAVCRCSKRDRRRCSSRRHQPLHGHPRHNCHCAGSGSHCSDAVGHRAAPIPIRARLLLWRGSGSAADRWCVLLCMPGPRRCMAALLLLSVLSPASTGRSTCMRRARTSLMLVRCLWPNPPPCLVPPLACRASSRAGASAGGKTAAAAGTTCHCGNA